MRRVFVRKSVVRRSLAALALSTCLSGAVVIAQENAGQEKLPERPTITIELVGKTQATEKADNKPEKAEESRPEVGEYWLGIQLSELTDSLRTQLGIKSGVVVSGVMPDSPASKADVKPHDVVVEVSGKAIDEPSDLIGVVNESKGKELELTLIRSAKKLTLKLTPTKRPEGQLAAAPQEDGLQGDLWQGVFDTLLQRAGLPGQPPIVLWQAQPPMALQAHHLHVHLQGLKLPKNVSVQIMKTGEEPARIVVKRDEKTYEATEGKLDEIPSDLRPHVERMLGGNGAWAIAAPHVRILHGQPAAPMPGIPPMPAMPQVKPLERRPQIRAKAEERLQEARPGTAKADQELNKKLEAVLDRLEKLQADVDALKK